MATVTSLLCNKFGGIRRIRTSFSSDKITCSDCQNVEFFYTEINSGVGIKTSKGNIALFDVTEKVVDIYESTQNGVKYVFIYTETQTEGKLYRLDIAAKAKYLLKDGLTATGQSSATTVAQGWSDQFIFSNGEEILNVQIGRINANSQLEEVQELKLKDRDDRDVKGLGLVLFDGRLWIFKDNVLWYSRTESFDDFATNDPDQKTSAGYIEHVKPITAIIPYLGSLAIFHSDSSILLSVGDDLMFSQGDESPGGCASHKSLVFHGTELYFYDDSKKGMFSFRQVVNGDKTLGDNIAVDIQNLLCKIDINNLNKIKAQSIITEDKNEIWILIPTGDTQYSTILIYDYLNQEWLRRKEPTINCFGVIGNRLISAGTKIFEEYVGNTFDGEYIESYYDCTPFNLGMDNSLKILCFPPRVTVDVVNTTEFYTKYTKNYVNLKKTKQKLIKTKVIKNALYWDKNNWDDGYFWAAPQTNSIYKLSSATFKTLKITFMTLEAGQHFSIKNLEFTKIKVKQI